MSYKYDVFFSYRHKPLDGEITSKGFQLVESYRLPDSLKNKGYKDIERAFRDTEELPVSRILTDTIDKALNSANTLIVVCSTDTPSSEWVDREVETFIELGRASHIYPLLINGDEDTSFPPSLKKIPDIQERIMDVRVPGGAAKDILKKAPDQLLKAVADITGCPEAQLRREDSFRRNKKLMRRALTVAAVLLFTGAVSYALMSLAQNYRDEAQLQEEATMRILSGLTYDLPDKLTNVPGAYSRIADILEDNTETIEAIIGLSSDGSKAVYEAAANREKLANARSVLGMYDKALEAEDSAMQAFGELAGSGEDAHILAYGSSYNNRGSIYHAAGRYEEAGKDYRQAVVILQSMAEPDRLVLARIYGNSAANAISMGDDSADSFFEKAMDLLKDGQDDPAYVLEAAEILYNRGVGLYRIGQYEKAAGFLEASAEKYRALLNSAETRQNRTAYLQSISVLSACLTDGGKYEEAEFFYQTSEKEAEELAGDNENLNDRVLLAELYNNHGLCLNIQGKYEQADGLYRKASELYRQVNAAAESASSAVVYAVSLLNTGENAFKAGHYDETKQFFEEGLGVFEEVLEELDSYDQAQYYTWLSYHKLIDLRDYAGSFEAGVTACTLQPDSVLANMDLGYACLYCGYEEDCVRILSAVASLGEGQAETIRKDLEAQSAAGMDSEYAGEILRMLDEM